MAKQGQALKDRLKNVRTWIGARKDGIGPVLLVLAGVGLIVVDRRRWWDETADWLRESGVTAALLLFLAVVILLWPKARRERFLTPLVTEFRGFFWTIAILLCAIALFWISDFDHRENIAAAGLALIAGLFLLRVAVKVLNVTSDAMLVTSLLAPLVLYLFIGGYIRTAKLPGGFEFDFAIVANSAAPRAPAIAELPSNVEINRTPTVQAEELRANAVIIAVGAQSNSATDLWKYLRTHGNIHFIVFVETNGVFIGFVPAQSVRGILDRCPDGADLASTSCRETNQLFANIAGGQSPQIPRLFGSDFRTDKMTGNPTTLQALQEMEVRGNDAVALLDQNGRFVAVIEREHVLSQLLLGLVTTGTATATATSGS